MANRVAAAFKAIDPWAATDLAGSRAAFTVRPGNPGLSTSRSEPAGACSDALRFGSFRCLPSQMLLFDGDAPVRLGSRAFGILIALLNRQGELVSKEELIAEVWPDTTVEAGNLRVHMAALRKALRDQDENSKFICTIPGRGYRFIAPVLHAAAPMPPAPLRVAGASAAGLPISLTRAFGRSDFIAALIAQLPDRRFVTIVGPGGIGKTKVAVATAEMLAGSYPDGVRLVDLAAVTEAGEVPNALAEALGVGVGPREPAADPISFLADKRMLIVIDNCEHLVEATADLVERVSKGTCHVHILATSREPLRNAGEWVRRLPPLSCPPASRWLTAAEASTYPAVQLFVDRISASDGAWALNDDNAPVVGEICRKLDGIPLAIELAAGRVEAFGINGLAAQLEQPLRLLIGGRRTASSRHQTLSGTLDWSYRSLSEVERAVLCRLAIFAGEFTLPAACSIAANAAIASSTIVENIASLVSKSLVIAEFSEEVVRYRLLGATRIYAFGKLAANA